MNKLLVTFAILLTCGVIFLAGQGQEFRRVDAGGANLRMLLRGDAGPTVVFESGAGSPLETWVRIQPAVSRFAKTVSYDRAGNGLSTKGSTPRDGRHIAIELHTALPRLGLRPPYVLVGHSLGGAYIRVFAGMYPREIAGLVLVNPTQEELMAWAKAREAKPVEKHAFRPDDEVDCAPLTFAQAKESRLPPGIPVALIAGMGPRDIPGFLTKALRKEVDMDQKIFYPAKLRFYRQWLEKLPGRQLIVTENSGHGVPFEEPDLVIRAIRDVVRRANSAN